MAISINDVEHVAKLAKLRFTREEMERLVHELNAILKHMEQLNTLDTSGLEPLSQIGDLINVMRDDNVVPSLPRDEALKNAPDRTDEFFKVPKVIGGT